MRYLKKVFLVGLMVLIPLGTVLAQTEKGDKELSFSAALQHTNMTGKRYGVQLTDSIWSICLDARMGFYLTKNIEIEPEIAVSKIGKDLFDEEDPKLGYSISCNLAYNFTSKKKTVPFVLAGIGLSNAIPFYHNISLWGLEKTTFKLINAGTGLKLFVGDSRTLAIRLEYRFQYYFGAGDRYEDTTYTCHYGLVGLSVFL